MMLTIDIKSRKITIPNEENVFGVYHDANTDGKEFRVDKFTSIGFNLSTLKIYINYMLPNSDDVYRYEVKDAKMTGDAITFSWILDRNATQNVGDLLFTVCFKDVVGNDEILNEWNTTITRGMILEGIEPELDEEDHEELVTLYDQFLAKMSEGNYYTKTEVDALISRVNDKLPNNPSGGTGFTSTQLSDLCGALKGAKYDTLEASLSAKRFVESIEGGGSDEPIEPPTQEGILDSITAVYSGESVPVGTDIESLRPYIVVTGHYTDGTSKTMTGFNLEGTIAEGNNSITVLVDDKTTTITVVGVAESSIYPIEARFYGLLSNAQNNLSNLPENAYYVAPSSGITMINNVALVIPLKSGKTYQISITNDSASKYYYSACAVNLDKEPSRVEIVSVTQTPIESKPQINGVGVNAEETKTATYTPSSNCWMMIGGNNNCLAKIEVI